MAKEALSEIKIAKKKKKNESKKETTKYNKRFLYVNQISLLSSEKL